MKLNMIALASAAETTSRRAKHCTLFLAIIIIATHVSKFSSLKPPTMNRKCPHDVAREPYLVQ
jgi:hypothetical protein